MQALRELSTVDRSLTYAQTRRFVYAAAGVVTIDQDIAHVGGTVWDAGVVLSHYLDSLGSAALQGKRIIELGAGTALPSIVSARLGAVVVATDMSDVLPYTIAAIDGNCSPKTRRAIEAEELIWGIHGIGLKALAQEHCDFIVAADVVYNAKHFAELQETFQALSTAGTRVLICFEQRRRDLAAFWASCEPYFSVALVSTPILDTIRQEAKIYLYELTPRLVS
ncbi:hypothetical protein ACHHYP_11330 [Achlya hypogyna]|uniref:Uncharacterized protein n=1 Tax=Achlya hypogyna TaxID=1202772 RepID=A0A1V9YJ95_ACHHY|nr:hypothetical protein ACHHYP_11330 [Achlya hypogyna]